MFPANSGKTGLVNSKRSTLPSQATGGILKQITWKLHIETLKTLKKSSKHLGKHAIVEQLGPSSSRQNYNSNCVLTSACKNRFELQNDIQLSALAEFAAFAFPLQKTLQHIFAIIQRRNCKINPPVKLSFMIT
uniref:Uncharacterized protein n=1 Tax=Glossina pallidipes TaxID=7398 RepID=A0A1A9ZCB1_GLOPL